jgi:hypothetical protein
VHSEYKPDQGSASTSRYIQHIDESIVLTPKEAAKALGDEQWIQWLQSRKATVIINESASNKSENLQDKHAWSQRDGFQFYLMTFTFECSMPRASACLDFYDTYIDRSIHKLSGYNRQRITFIGEYEEGGPVHAPRHIHAIVGIPSVEHVIRRFERAIHKKCSLNRIRVKVDLSAPLQSANDIERVYWYIRKWKTHRPMGA